MKKKKLAGLMLVWALLAGCGTDSVSPGPAAGVAAPTTLAAPAPETVTTTAPDVMEAAIEEGLFYHPGGELFASKAGAIDVIAPTDGGPWPTVVVFHGDPRNAGKGWHRSDARAIAEQGRVVFLPAWGHLNPVAVDDMGTQAAWDLNVRELKCAVAYAQARTADYGGDPEHITLYGLSAGGNAVLMASLANAEPLETCAVPGPAVSVQALVPIDADWLLGGSWDLELGENPEAFYSMTPWRMLDGSQDIPIHVMVTEIVGPYSRSVEPDAAASWLSYRHPDIDLVVDLTERGFLDDGELSLRESGAYATQVLTEAGYDVSLVVMPGAAHASWGEEGTAAVVETVLNAEG